MHSSGELGHSPSFSFSIFSGCFTAVLLIRGQPPLANLANFVVTFKYFVIFFDEGAGRRDLIKFTWKFGGEREGFNIYVFG